MVVRGRRRQRRASALRRQRWLRCDGVLGLNREPRRPGVDALPLGEQNGMDGPFLVGVERTGLFAEHAEQIHDLIPAGQVMSLTNAYINRVTGPLPGNEYERGEFYGRRFLYRTTTGSVLVVTVPLKAGVSPYTGPGCEDFASYPTLRPRGRVAAGCRALRPMGDVPGEFEADADPPDQGTARLRAVTIEPASSGRTQLKSARSCRLG